jgi:hypothetical protein
MEKYRQFADARTGVNPFVPVWSINYKPSLLMKAAKVLIFFPLSLIRLGVFMVAMIWLVLSSCSVGLIPLGFIRRPIERILLYIGCKVALTALGVLPLSDSLADNRRLKLAAFKSPASSSFSDASYGTLIIVNQQGITDVLYLCMKLCPTFVFVAADGAPVELSLIAALMRASARRPATPPVPKESLETITKRARSRWGGPVVIFPEGARTNGAAILKWSSSTFAGWESLGSLDKPIGTALLTIEYSKGGAYTPHHTVGTTFRHIFWLCMQPFHTLRTVWLPAAEVAAAVKSKACNEQIAMLRTLLARMLPEAVETEVDAKTHLQFMGFWDASRKKGYTKPKKES